MIIEYKGKRPQIADDVFIAPNATIIGDVVIESGANIWFGCVLRGDEGKIVIGPRVSVQDNTVVHTNPRNSTIVEAEATIGHSVVLEGCRIERQALIGMNATILDGASVGARALVAAGSVVREYDEIPADVLAAGVPARVKGPLSDSARRHVLAASADYQAMANTYKRLNLKPQYE
jgi:carbonic anhydrase/acetyltransferase-like protein (isoleucine patch superfamily)